MAVASSSSHAEWGGKVVLVTGGSKGIGEGCARAFCQAGARVVICARGREAGDDLAVALTAQGPGQCLFLPCDVHQPDEIRSVVDQTVAHYGRLDVLVNNAGYHPPHKAIDDFSVDDLLDVLQTNLVSYFVAAQRALPHLRQVRGSIINIGSLVAVMGQQLATTYCASKGGISAFNRALAIEEARYGVRVNEILPGNIVTQSRVDAIAQMERGADFDRLVDSWQWPGRSGTIEEVGQACLFLASNGASFITGVQLIISGGAELGYGIKAPWKLGMDVDPTLYPRPVA